MKLVAVEHLFGGDRIIFYFLAETRVDFRALVRDLAQEYRTRIEMRQIGVRDEARLLGDYERCGRPLCCRAWIKELQPVSMKMAKLQKATLDPTKISGRCGRLMCCLRFEDTTYRDLVKNLPRRNTYVRLPQGVARVVDGDVVTQIVAVQMEDGKRANVPVESIVERDVAPPPAAEAARQGGPEGPPREGAGRDRRGGRPGDRRSERPPDRSSGRPPDRQPDPRPDRQAEPPAAPEAAESAAAPAEGEAGPPAPAPAEQAAGAPGTGQRGKRRRHRRRSRRGRRGAGGPGAPGAPGAGGAGGNAGQGPGAGHGPDAGQGG
jgi:hypothetical protein